MKSVDYITNTHMFEQVDRSFQVFKYMRNEGEQGL